MDDNASSFVQIFLQNICFYIEFIDVTGERLTAVVAFDGSGQMSFTLVRYFLERKILIFFRTKTKSSLSDIYPRLFTSHYIITTNF
jgi:hypothetical protein